MRALSCVMLCHLQHARRQKSIQKVVDIKLQSTNLQHQVGKAATRRRCVQMTRSGWTCGGS